MAVIEDAPGIEARILVNGVALNEYENNHAPDEDEALQPTCTSYVECVSNASFAIEAQITHDYEWGYRNHALLIRVDVDGTWIRSSIVRPGDLPMRVTGTQEYCESTGRWTGRALHFAAVKTIESTGKERVERDVKIAKDLGLIHIEIRRVIVLGPSYHSQRGTSLRNQGGFELAEKALKGKAVSHGTSFGEERSMASPRFSDTEDLPEDNAPIAVFRFFYRSREALKRELIIPRSPSRSPTLDGLSEAERNRLARERLEELKNFKKEGDPVIKREFGEVLDLTLDDDDVPFAPARPTKKVRLDSGEVVEAVDLTED